MSFVGHFSVITDFTLELLVRLIVIVYEGPDLCAPFENQISGHIINLILLNYLTNLALHIMVRVLKVLKTIDLNKLDPKLLMIEASTLDISERDKIISYLKLQNYKILYDNKVNVIFNK